MQVNFQKAYTVLLGIILVAANPSRKHMDAYHCQASYMIIMVEGKAYMSIGGG